MLGLIRRNPARVLGLVSAIFLLLVAYGVEFPQEAWLGVVVAALALLGGEGAQRIEDGKTNSALWTEPPLEEEYVGEHEADYGG